MLGDAVFLITYVGLWLLVVLQSLVLIELVRRVNGGRVSPQTNATQDEPERLLSTGTLAPRFKAVEITSTATVDSETLLGRPVTLVFVGANCSACAKVTDELVERHRSPNQERDQVVVICMGKSPDCKSFVDNYLPGVPTLWDQDLEIARQFKVKQTPTLIQLDPTWRVLRYGVPQLRLGLT